MTRVVADAAYVHLADVLGADIDRMAPGARLPSEHDLAAAYDVSRITARGALQELENRHVVRRTQGSGTFVALRLPYPIRPGELPSWSGLVAAAGHDPSYRYLDNGRRRGGLHELSEN